MPVRLSIAVTFTDVADGDELEIDLVRLSSHGVEIQTESSFAAVVTMSSYSVRSWSKFVRMPVRTSWKCDGIGAAGHATP